MENSAEEIASLKGWSLSTQLVGDLALAIAAWLHYHPAFVVSHPGVIQWVSADFSWEVSLLIFIIMFFGFWFHSAYRIYAERDQEAKEAEYRLKTENDSLKEQLKQRDESPLMISGMAGVETTYMDRDHEANCARAIAAHVARAVAEDRKQSRLEYETLMTNCRLAELKAYDLSAQLTAERASREDAERRVTALRELVRKKDGALAYYEAAPWVANKTGVWYNSNFAEVARAALALTEPTAAEEGKP